MSRRHARNKPAGKPSWFRRSPREERGERAAAAREPGVSEWTGGHLALLCLALVFVTGAFAFHLKVRFDGVRLGYETSRARAQQTRLLLEQRELRLELASLKAPQRIESEAREKLGMEVPDHRRIVTIGNQPKQVTASGGAL